MTDKERAEVSARFLIDSWSYSSVSTFSRNEKAFERSAIYREQEKRSASSVAGNAYHAALEFYFNAMKDNEPLPDAVKLTDVAYNCIIAVPANDWKIQKTCPTVEDAVLKAVKLANELIGNFLAEVSVYTDDIQEVLGVEWRLEEYLTINGVEIPLPCHLVMDLVVRLKNGKVAIIDHKSKAAYTDEQELSMTAGKQGITYYKGLESHAGIKADEVWFVENKYSKNKDKSPQLRKNIIELNEDTVRLYEAMLYEPLRRVLEATSNPDYIYTINDRDNLCDIAEVYDFWTRTMIAEVDDFPLVPKEKRPLIEQRLKKVRNSSLSAVSPKAISRFRENAATFITYDYTNANMTNSEKIEHKLRSLGVLAKVAHEIDGFSSNSYLLEVSAGENLARIARYKLDIANALNVPSVRIGSELLVYEGKSYLCIEASKKREKTLDFDLSALSGTKIPVGVDNFGKTVVWDLDNHSTPHALVCGATGSGKSVCLRSTIEYAQHIGDISEIILFDPKYEFTSLGGKVTVVNDIDKIEGTMKELVAEMQDRASSGRSYSKTLIIFDEFADAVMSARSGKALDIYEEQQEMTSRGFKTKKVCVGREKSLEENLKMLLQKGRSLGYRIMAATQRASAKVITGDAKVNFPVQICFRVPKAIDSKVVIDEEGAESLAGYGDGLMKSPEYLTTTRFQGYFLK